MYIFGEQPRLLEEQLHLHGVESQIFADQLCFHGTLTHLHGEEVALVGHRRKCYILLFRHFVSFERFNIYFRKNICPNNCPYSAHEHKYAYMTLQKYFFHYDTEYLATFSNATYRNVLAKSRPTNRFENQFEQIKKYTTYKIEIYMTGKQPYNVRYNVLTAWRNFASARILASCLDPKAMNNVWARMRD